MNCKMMHPRKLDIGYYLGMTLGISFPKIFPNKNSDSRREG